MIQKKNSKSVKVMKSLKKKNVEVMKVKVLKIEQLLFLVNKLE